ncbi:hypothetical protein GCM10020219_042260 [Nonomuraea dietziae]
MDGDHTVDKPASYDRLARLQPPFWATTLLAWRCLQPAGTLEIVFERSFTPNPGDDRAWWSRLSGGKPGRRQPRGPPQNRRPATPSCTGAYESDNTRCCLTGYHDRLTWQGPVIAP